MNEIKEDEIYDYGQGVHYNMSYFSIIEIGIEYPEIEDEV